MAPRVPSLNWLRVFEAAARTESFARAAVQLNLSPAAVSQQVKALETQLGTPLFERRAQSVTLTESGRAYLPSVQQSLLMLDSSTRVLFGERREHRLFVQSVLLFAQGILVPAMAGFQTSHPGVNLVLSTANTAAEFSTRFTDLQIVFGSPASFGAQSDPLGGERLYPVAAPRIADRITAPQDLLMFPLIEVASHRAGWPLVLDSLRLPGGEARYLFSDNTIMAAAMAGQALGVALARAPASDLALAGAGLVRCLPDFEVAGREGYHLVYPDRGTLRPAARDFRAWLLDHLS